MSLIAVRARLIEARAANQESRDAILATVETEARTELTEEETARFAELVDEIRTQDARIAELDELARADQTAADAARSFGIDDTTGVLRVNREALTYRRDGEHSYFRDLARAHAPGGNADTKSMERLQRHRDEMDIETRALSRTDGAGGEFVPPLWLVDQYVPLARAGRVTADLCRSLPLPAGTDSINLPKIATGSATAAQTEGSAVQNTDLTTTSVNAPVITVAGQQVTSMQLVDQSPINVDEVIFMDLLKDLAVKVDAQVLNGSGTAPNARGILNVAGINAVTYTDASPTVPELYPKVADGIQQIHTARFTPPQAIVMHPRRWAWHLAALDSSTRPLVVPNAQGPTNAFAGMSDVRSEGAVGSLQGLPVYVDPNIPTNLGAGTNEDRVIIAVFDDLYLYEGALRTRVLFETDANTLQVRFQAWEYLAFLGGRLPASVAVVSGTGLITPTF